MAGMVAGHVYLWHAKDGWRWRAVARNGEIIAQNQRYFIKWNAKRAGKKIAKAFGFDMREIHPKEQR